MHVLIPRICHSIILGALNHIFVHDKNRYEDEVDCCCTVLKQNSEQHILNMAQKHPLTEFTTTKIDCP